MPKAKTKLAEQLPERNTPFHVGSDMEDDVRAVIDYAREGGHRLCSRADLYGPAGH